MIKTPLLVINFKNYPEALGRKAVELAKLADKVSKELGVSIAVAPPMPTLMKVVEEVDIPVLAQHADPVKASSTTGYTPAESIAEAGAVGSIINHSEHKLELNEVEEVVRRLKELNLVSLVCASRVEEAESIARIGPDFIAIEPPELIGSGRAVSKVSPDIVTTSVVAVRRINENVKVLCGAGITSGEDVSLALKLGSHGVLVASGIVKSPDKYGVIKEMGKALL